MSNKGQTVYDRIYNRIATWRGGDDEADAMFARLVEILAQKGVLTPSDVSALLGETIKDGEGEG